MIFFYKFMSIATEIARIQQAKANIIRSLARVG